MNQYQYLFKLIFALTSFFSFPVFGNTLCSVGSPNNSPPFTFYNSNSNTWSGAMIDIFASIAILADFEYEIKPTVFSELIPGIISENFQIGVSGMINTKARQKLIQFSQPLFEINDTFIINKKNKDKYRSIKDLKGKTVGAQAGTVFVKMLKNFRGKPFFKQVMTYSSVSEMMDDVAQGNIDGAISDVPNVMFYLSKGSYSTVHRMKKYKPMWSGKVSLIVGKDETEFVQRINSAIKSMKNDGTLSLILDKWKIEHRNCD